MLQKCFKSAKVFQKCFKSEVYFHKWFQSFHKSFLSNLILPHSHTFVNTTTAQLNPSALLHHAMSKSPTEKRREWRNIFFWHRCIADTHLWHQCWWKLTKASLTPHLKIGMILLDVWLRTRYFSSELWYKSTVFPILLVFNIKMCHLRSRFLVGTKNHDGCYVQVVI